MSGNKKDKFKFNSYIIPILLMVVIIIAILSSFGVRMIADAKSRVEADYHKETIEISNIYEKNIYAIEKTAHVISAELLGSEDIFSEENINTIKVDAETLGVKNIYIVKPDFSAVDAKGKQYTGITNYGEIKEVFESKMNTNKFLKDPAGNKALYIINPITDRMMLKGYVLIEYVPDIMETLLNNPKYSSRKTYALVSSDGNIIESTGNHSAMIDENDNIIKTAEELLYIDGSYNLLRQAVSDCRSGSIKAMYKEQGKYVYYTPVGGCKAVVMMLVDIEDVDRSFAAVSKNIREMLIGIGLTVVAFLAIFLAISMFNKARYNIESEDLQNKADTDLLTDLYNKIATERMIKEYLEGEGKDKVSMLFVLDVDDFKKINDTRGHAFGDQVLSQLGHQIRSWFRVNDILGRIGGDEFMIFVKDVKDPEVIRREGSRIMQFFKGFNVGEYTKYSPTASVGGAVYPNDGKSFEELYQAADKAVYKSKKEGKNRVSFYCDLNGIEKEEAEKEVMAKAAK